MKPFILRFLLVWPIAALTPESEALYNFVSNAVQAQSLHNYNMFVNPTGKMTLKEAYVLYLTNGAETALDGVLKIVDQESVQWADLDALLAKASSAASASTVSNPGKATDYPEALQVVDPATTTDPVDMLQQLKAGASCSSYCSALVKPDCLTDGCDCDALKQQLCADILNVDACSASLKSVVTSLTPATTDPAYDHAAALLSTLLQQGTSYCASTLKALVPVCAKKFDLLNGANCAARVDAQQSALDACTGTCDALDLAYLNKKGKVRKGCTFDGYVKDGRTSWFTCCGYSFGILDLPNIAIEDSIGLYCYYAALNAQQSCRARCWCKYNDYNVCFSEKCPLQKVC